MSTQSNHTAGPWHIGLRQPTSDKFIYGASGEEIADCDRETNFPQDNLANARLVSAAPELLAALQYCLEAANAHESKALHSGKLYEIVQEKARAAIAKATGGQS